MHQGIEFQGRLSRSDRLHADPGPYDLSFQLYPKPGSSRVLWSEVIRQVEVRSGGFFSVILGQVTPMAGDLFSKAPRWLAVQVVRSGRPDGEQSSRTPLMGDSLRLQAKLSALSDRLSHLEHSFIGEDSVGRSSRLRALPRRFEKIYSDLRTIQDRLVTLEGGEAVLALAQDVRMLAGGLAGLSAPSGRVTQVEDELEDLIGPHGDVVDLNQRMDALERRILVGDGAGAEVLTEMLRTFSEEVSELSARQGKLERSIRRLHDAAPRGPQEQTATYVTAQPVPPGSLVVVVDGKAQLSRRARDPGVIGVVLSATSEEAVVAVGGVCVCRVIGPIEAGDILVAAAVPGVATPADEPPLPGIALGRALDSHRAGEGTIRIRVI